MFGMAGEVALVRLGGLREVARRRICEVFSWRTSRLPCSSKRGIRIRPAIRG
jgi:hypothetical protein